MRNLGWSLVVAVAFGGVYVLGQNSAPLRMLQSIPITGVEGRIDHFSIDVKGQRLFVAALGNNSVEVIDLSQGKRIHSITGLKEPQGLLYASDLNQLFVANGEDGTLRVFDTKSFALITSLKLGTDADNVRFDSGTGRVLVGYGEGALGVVDPRTQKLLATIKLAGHPESFQLEKSRPRIYVNVPDAKHIAVIDTSKQAVTATWSTGELQANFPMALTNRITGCSLASANQRALQCSIQSRANKLPWLIVPVIRMMSSTTRKTVEYTYRPVRVSST